MLFVLFCQENHLSSKVKSCFCVFPNTSDLFVRIDNDKKTYQIPAL